MLERNFLDELHNVGLSFLASHAEAADEADAPSHRHSGEGIFQTRRLVLTGFRKRDEDGGGEQCGDMAASSRSSCAFQMAAPAPSPRPGLPDGSCCSRGRPGGWEAHATGQQLGPGRAADSCLGSFVGHSGELVTDAAQAV